MPITKTLVSLSLVTVGGVLMTLIRTDLAQALTFTFNSQDHNSSTVTKTIDGLTLTLLKTSSTGVLQSGSIANFSNGFQFYFSDSVKIVSYTLDILSSVGNIGTLNSNPVTKTFNADFSLLAGDTASVTANQKLIQWKAIEVELLQTPPTNGGPNTASVPEPSSMLSLMALGLLGAGSVLKQSQNNK